MTKLWQSILASIALFLLVILVPAAVWAQDATAAAVNDTPVIQDVQGLRLQIAKHTQDPYTKQVRLEVVVYSQITSDRVQVVWNVNGSSKLISPTGGVSTLSVVPNQYYVVSAVILPQGLGTTQVVARVQAFQADGAYLSTASLNIGSLSNGDVFPVTPAYLIAQVIFFIRGLAVAILVIIFLIIAAYFAFKRFQMWLNRDN